MKVDYRDKNLRWPDWLKREYYKRGNISRVSGTLKRGQINTICVSARCPNLNRCFESGCATFLILGNVCSRNCTFCAVKKSSHGHKLQEIGDSELYSIVRAVKDLGLRHVVITSVSRDDLEDMGASQFIKIISMLKESDDSIVVELLIPDLKGKRELLESIIEAGPDILNHNVETIERLYPKIRPEADFKRSIELLRSAVQGAVQHSKNIVIKSGFMVGLGETQEEIFSLLNDLNDCKCDIVTIGQYLRPSLEHFPVKRYVTKDLFEEFKRFGERLGIGSVYSGPFIRSSFNAKEVFQCLTQGEKENYTEVLRKL